MSKAQVYIGGKDNLTSGHLQNQKWDSNSRQASLDEIFKHVTEQAQNSIDWYLERKESKKRWAQFIRFFVITLTAFAGLIPLLSETEAFAFLPSILTSITLAMAVTIGAYDKFYGYSSAWMRYLTAQMKIRNKLQLFRVNWEIQRATLKNEPPSDDQLEEMLFKCRSFLMEINQIIENEMHAWQTEFQATLNELDKASQAVENKK